MLWPLKIILYYGSLGSVEERTLKRPKKKIWNSNSTNKDSMDVKNINVIVCEKEILYSKINGSGNDFMNNLYDHGLVMFSNQLSFK